MTHELVVEDFDDNTLDLTSQNLSQVSDSFVSDWVLNIDLSDNKIMYTC